MKKKSILVSLLFVVLILGGNLSSVNAAENLVPKIISVTPSQIQKGDEIDVYGENFGDIQAYGWSIFDKSSNTNQQIINWTNNKIRLKTDNISLGWPSLCFAYRIYTDGYERSPSICFDDIGLEVCSTANCTVVSPMWPEIVSINPNVIRLGEEVKVIGKNFGETQAYDVSGKWHITDNGNHPQQILSWSDTLIKIKVDVADIGINHLCIEGKSEIRCQSPMLTIKGPCTIDDAWKCTAWDECPASGIQTRTCEKTSECQNWPEAPLTQTCTPRPTCTADTWSCSDWSACSAVGNSGMQSRTCVKTFECPIVETPSPKTVVICTPQITCSEDIWSCGSWGSCSTYGTQNRICTKTFECPTVETLSSVTQQNCAPPQPTCTADTWTCEAWGACSLSGIQSRNCSKTFDCPSVQTAPPITDQFCEAPNRPQQAVPSESEEITNQDTIIKATVKLLCPVDEQKASQGSGTMIDSAGTILTNKHVIAGTLGCLVGFIDNFSDEPYFGDRQIADIIKVSSNQDIAVLKIRNPKNKSLPYVNTTNGNVNFALGTKVTTYGYPAKFGTKVTYTSGDFSGNDGVYLKTTAILEYGNSGGGAYLKNGTYIGIPSAVVKGELNAMGYILSINTIRAWLNNSTVASGNTNNNYSRVSVLEDIDLKKLGSLKLFIPNVDKNSNLVTPATNQNTQKTTDQPQTAPQQESIIIESNNLNKKNTIEQNTSSTQNVSSTPERQLQKTLLIKRFFLWLSNLFNRLATR